MAADLDPLQSLNVRKKFAFATAPMLTSCAARRVIYVNIARRTGLADH